MTKLLIEGKSYVLSTMYLGKLTLNNKGAVAFGLYFSHGGGSIEYAVLEEDAPKIQVFQKAVAFIENKLKLDVPEIDITPVLHSLDVLGFIEVDTLLGHLEPTGMVARDLKKQSKAHVEGIFVKNRRKDSIEYYKVSASKFSVSLYTQVTTSSFLRLYIKGTTGNGVPAIDYSFNVRLSYLDNEHNNDNGIHVHCKKLIEELANNSGVVDLNEVMVKLHSNLSAQYITQESVILTFL